MTTRDLNRFINTILPLVPNTEHVDMHGIIEETIPELDGETRECQHIVSEMERLNLISVAAHSSGRYIVIREEGKRTSFGTEVIEKGGWLRYLQLENIKHGEHAEAERLIKEELKLNIQQMRFSLFQIKNWWWVVILAAIFSMICNS